MFFKIQRRRRGNIFYTCEFTLKFREDLEEYLSGIDYRIQRREKDVAYFDYIILLFNLDVKQTTHTLVSLYKLCH